LNDLDAGSAANELSEANKGKMAYKSTKKLVVSEIDRIAKEKPLDARQLKPTFCKFEPVDPATATTAKDVKAFVKVAAKGEKADVEKEFNDASAKLTPAPFDPYTTTKKELLDESACPTCTA